MDLCRRLCHCFEWGGQNRAGLLALNYMFNQMDGLQIRFWSIQPKMTIKKTPDNAAREEGYRFIREKGPKTNNRNQFMEWTDQQIHTPGSPIEGWQEGKVVTALTNYICVDGRTPKLWNTGRSR